MQLVAIALNLKTAKTFTMRTHAIIILLRRTRISNQYVIGMMVVRGRKIISISVRR